MLLCYIALQHRGRQAEGRARQDDRNGRGEEGGRAADDSDAAGPVPDAHREERFAAVKPATGSQGVRDGSGNQEAAGRADAAQDRAGAQGDGVGRGEASHRARKTAITVREQIL